jgi:hypothetical protein
MTQEEEQLNAHNNETIRRNRLLTLESISFAELEAVFAKWMIIPDTGIVKFITAFYCANKLPGKALWAFIIGPSGGGKTEFLNALLPLIDVEPISMLTTNTFLSGMPGANDASLLPKVTGKILLFKDWTTILSMQKDAKAEIMSQFRELWDGSMKKMFGNGRIAVWKGKVSVLAATTQAVDLNQQQYTHLGERFLNYRVIMPDRKAAAHKALDNDAFQEQMSNELQEAMFCFLKGIDYDGLVKSNPTIPNKYRDEIVNLANFCTMARSGIIRDFGMKKDVIFVPDSEMPTRIAGQLAKLGAGLIMTNKGEFMESDMDIIYKTALDSIPKTNKMVIIEMARGDGQSTAQIATALGYPTEPIKIYLENLAMLKVCKRKKESGNSYRWELLEEFADIIRKYENIKLLTDDEIKKRPEELFDTEEESGIDMNEFALDPLVPENQPSSYKG